MSDREWSKFVKGWFWVGQYVGYDETWRRAGYLVTRTERGVVVVHPNAISYSEGI